MTSHRIDRDDDEMDDDDESSYLIKGTFASTAVMPFRLDEGYSEETRSQAETQAAQLSAETLPHLDWVSALGEKARAGTLDHQINCTDGAAV